MAYYNKGELNSPGGEKERMTNSDMLMEAIKKSGLKLGYICAELHITRATFRNKLQNKSEFLASEIIKLSEMLKLDPDQTQQIFLGGKAN
jgi:hypothetical protein